MRIGIAGTGSMGSVHAEGWMATDAVIGGFLADRSGMAQQLAAHYQARVYADYAELLADVDVVDICTPTHTHADLAIAAAQAGRHVICEKPLARTLAQGQQMIVACQAAGVQLLVAHVVRFFPEYARAWEIVQRGEIGVPAVLRLERGSYQPQKAEGNWLFDVEQSGGILLDLMIHDLDFARWIAGDVETVFAKSIVTRPLASAVDQALVLLQHYSGAISHVSASWVYPPPTFRTAFEIAGETGLLEFQSPQSTPIEMLLHRQATDVAAVAVPSSPLHESPYVTQLREFYEVIAHGVAPRVSAIDGLAALQISLAAIESAMTGRAVRLAALGGAE